MNVFPVGSESAAHREARLSRRDHRPRDDRGMVDEVAGRGDRHAGFRRRRRRLVQGRVRADLGADQAADPEGDTAEPNRPRRIAVLLPGGHAPPTAGSAPASTAATPAELRAPAALPHPSGGRYEIVVSLLTRQAEARPRLPDRRERRRNRSRDREEDQPPARRSPTTETRRRSGSRSSSSSATDLAETRRCNVSRNGSTPLHRQPGRSRRRQAGARGAQVGCRNTVPPGDRAARQIKTASPGSPATS